MHKIVLAFLLLNFTLINAQTPNFKWANKMGGLANYTEGHDIASDRFGNVYMSGVFTGTTDFDPGPGTASLAANGFGDGFVTKWDTSGNFLWVKTISGPALGGEISAISTDPNGNLYVLGTGVTGTDLDPGPSVYSITSTYAFTYLLKLNLAGNVSWIRIITGSTGQVGSGDLNIDDFGAIYFTGNYIGLADFDPGPASYTLSTLNTNSQDQYVVKLDSAGNFSWVRTFVPEYYSATSILSIAPDRLGNLYLTGTYGGVLDFDPGPSTYSLSTCASNNYDSFILKLNSSGNFVWVNTYGNCSGPSDYGKTIVTDNLSNVYSVGNFGGIVDFDTGPGTFTLNSVNYPSYMMKLNSAGNLSWVRNIGTGMFMASNDHLAIDAGKNLYFSGFYTGTASLDPGGTNFTAPSAGYVDGSIAAYDSTGIFKWAGRVGGPDSDDRIYGVAVGMNGSIYYTGAFSSTVGDFDPFAPTYTLASPSTTNSAFLARLAYSCASFSITSNTSGSICPGGVFTFSPSGAYTFLLPGNSLTVSPASTSSFVVFGTNTLGCLSSNSVAVNVTVHPSPTISINSGSICSGLSFTLNPSGASLYSIQGGTNIVTPNITSTYSIAGTSSLGCASASAATATVTVYQSPTISVNNGSICAGDVFTINPTGASTFIISGGSATVSPLQSSSYSVVGLSNAGCASANTATANVVVYSLPTVAVNSGSICEGNSFTIIPSGASTYSISGGNFTVNPLLTNSYSISGTSQDGCLSPVVISNVSVVARPVISAIGGSICPGQIFTIVPNGASQYTYSSGSATVSPAFTTTYTVLGSGPEGCVSANASSLTLVVMPAPIIQANASNQTPCYGDSITLSGLGGLSYQWSGGIADNQPFTVSVSAIYTVIGTAANSCTNISAISIFVNPLPTVGIVSSSPKICAGESVTLSANGANQYTWSTNSTNSFVIVSPGFSSFYSVTGYDINGCSASYTIMQAVDPCTGLTKNTGHEQIKLYPNPTNGNIWIKFNSAEQRKISVFDLTGKLVIETYSSEENLQLETNTLLPGIYHVVIKTAGETVAIKFIRN